MAQLAVSLANQKGENATGQFLIVQGSLEEARNRMRIGIAGQS
jgi:hypothetical protein